MFLVIFCLATLQTFLQANNSVFAYKIVFYIIVVILETSTFMLNNPQSPSAFNGGRFIIPYQNPVYTLNMHWISVRNYEMVRLLLPGPFLAFCFRGVPFRNLFANLFLLSRTAHHILHHLVIYTSPPQWYS